MNLGGWDITDESDGVHVKPHSDLRPHGGADCWCHPQCDETIWVHNSLDGRERLERGEAKPS